MSLPRILILPLLLASVFLCHGCVCDSFPLLAAEQPAAFVVSPSKRQTKYTTLLLLRRQKLLQHASCLHQSSSDNNESGIGKVKFSSSVLSSVSSDSTITNPFDFVISLIVSDIGSIILGVFGLLALLFGKLLWEDNGATTTMDEDFLSLAGEETRTNLLAVLAILSILLNGISKLDVTSALAESVTLSGVSIDENSPISYDNGGKQVMPNAKSEEQYSVNSCRNWALTSLLKATPAQTAIVLELTTPADGQEEACWEIVSMIGTVPTIPKEKIRFLSTKMPILDRFRKDQKKETYLPTLQALPGKYEFTYLPENTQEVLLLPFVITNNKQTTTTTTDDKKIMALVLGSNRAKSFTPRDIAWCTSITKRMEQEG